MKNALPLLVLSGILVLISFVFSSIGVAEMNSTDNGVEVQVRAKKLRAHDEVSYSAHSITIEQPATDINLGETLSKLPGVLVREVSGFGSATTLISSQALGAGGTAVSIDDIPVIDSSGRGVNFALFPSTLISSIEHHSTFYPSVDPTTDTLPSPGGRINLRTLNPPKEGERPFSASVLHGSGESVQATGAYRDGHGKHDWVLGASGFNTEGNYHFKNPLNGEQNVRTNNDSWGAGALGKYRFRFRGKRAEVQAINIYSHEERTNPGSILFPSRDHQSDDYNLIGVRYKDPEAISERNGLFAKMSGAYSRTATRGNPFTNGADATDSRTFGSYNQMGYSRIDEQTSFTVSFDNQWDYLRDDSGVFNRDVFGATATLSVDIGKFRVVPLARQEASSRYPSAGDGSVSVIYMPDTKTDISVSYGLVHAYPSIIAAGGFKNSGIILLANPDLQVQRDSIATLAFVRREKKYTLYASTFYDLIRNRSTFVFVGRNRAQFVNSSEVSVFGGALDGQVFPIEELAIRGSVSLAKAFDRVTEHEMPYKPRVQGWTSVSYTFDEKYSFTVQEQYLSRRYTSLVGADAMSPYFQTTLRFDAQLGPGIAFVKVANLLDAPGFENPGFPIAGRTYWLGYTL